MTRCPNYNPLTVKAIHELDGAITAHANWQTQLHRALICGTTLDPDMLDIDGRGNCRFSAWYEARDAAQWHRWSEDLAQLDRLHLAIHEQAHRLATQRTATCHVAVEDFDDFSEHTANFKAAARSLQFKALGEVCLTDHLTGVWNRSSMFLRLAEEHERMTRQHQGCYLCMVDLDHFKTVNDALGHTAGDEVLRHFADIVRRRLRVYDSMFRYGGEEFLICLPNISAADATATMDRIRIEISAAPIAISGNGNIRLTASFGVAPLAEHLTIEESIVVADQALYCAKARGRDQVCRWDS